MKLLVLHIYGWTIEDSSSTQQIIGGGNILRVNGTTNEIEAVVSATDTLTIDYQTRNCSNIINSTYINWW